jgi:hypothetical protein
LTDRRLAECHSIIMKTGLFFLAAKIRSKWASKIKVKNISFISAIGNVALHFLNTIGL